jgi:hypothetical protein
MMWYHLSSGWRPRWYDPTLMTLLLGFAALQSIFVFRYSRDV